MAQLRVRHSIALGLSIVSLVACADSTAPDDPVAQARARWTAARPAQYQMVVSRATMSGTLTARVLVEGSGRVTVQPLDSASAAFAAAGGQFTDVDGLFSEARLAQQSGARVSGTFDTRYGFPTQLTVDADPRAIDDEVRYRIASFEVP